jgi:short-subunit dehydrogenase
MARRLAGSRVTVNCIEPGPTKTHFGDNMRGLPSLFPAIMKRLPLFRPATENARAIVFLASSSDLARTTGQYLVKTKPVRSASITYDRALAARHWAICEELTGLSEKIPSAAELIGSGATTLPLR